MDEKLIIKELKEIWNLQYHKRELIDKNCPKCKIKELIVKLEDDIKQERKERWNLKNLLFQ